MPSSGGLIDKITQSAIEQASVQVSVTVSIYLMFKDKVKLFFLIVFSYELVLPYEY